MPFRTAKQALERLDTPELVLSTTALFWPDLIEYDGFVFLQEGFSDQNVAVWKASELYGQAGMRGVAAAVNHRHVSDLLGPVSDGMAEADIIQVGEILGRCWKARLEQAFPNRLFDFEVGEEIWFWEGAPQAR